MKGVDHKYFRSEKTSVAVKRTERLFGHVRNEMMKVVKR